MKPALSLPLVLLLASCVSSRTLALGPQAGPAGDAALPIYESLDDLPVPYEKVGIVTADGGSWARLTRRLQAEGRNLGGDALVLRAEGARQTSTWGLTSERSFVTLPFHRKGMTAIVVRFVPQRPVAAAR